MSCTAVEKSKCGAAAGSERDWSHAEIARANNSSWSAFGVEDACCECTQLSSFGEEKVQKETARESPYKQLMLSLDSFNEAEATVLQGVLNGIGALCRTIIPGGGQKSRS